MEKKKILFCASTASHITNFHMPYLDHFKSIAFEVHTVSNGKVNSDMVDKAFDLAFDKKLISLKNIKTVFQMAGIIRSENYTVISSHATLAGAIARAAAIISGNKKAIVIHTSHGYLFKDDRSLKTKLHLFIEKILAVKTDLLVTMNKEDYAIATKYRLCKKIKFVHGCGIVPQKFPCLPDSEIQKIKKAYHIEQNQKVILCVGELSKRKNHKMLLCAFANIVSGKNIKLLLAGAGHLENACRALADELNIANDVVFCGYVNEIHSLYRIADIVVSASLSEGLPFNIMEALHCNIPVIASGVKGHTDLIVNNENGLLFPVDDLDKLQDCMRRLTTDEKLYQDIKSKAKLPKEYYIDSVASEIIEVYNEAIQQGG